MSKLEAEMEFEIGDTVTMAAHKDSYRLVAGTVVERHIVECHGGVQRVYGVCWDNCNKSTYPAVALVIYDPKRDPANEVWLNPEKK